MALILDGTDDVATIATLNNLDVAAITLAAWIKYDTAPASANIEVVCQFADASNSGPTLAIEESSGSVYPYFQYGWSTATGGAGKWRGSTALTAGRWYHVAATYDRSSSSNDAAIYLDGVAETVTETSAPSGTVRSGQDRGTIGSDRSASAYFDGSIQDVAAWDAVLSPRAVEAAYIRGAEFAAVSDRQAWWEFIISGVDRTGASDASLDNGATVDKTYGYPTSATTSIPANWSYAAGTDTGKRAVALLAIEGLTDVLCTDDPADPKTATKAISLGTTAYLASASTPNVFTKGDATIIVAYKPGLAVGGKPAIFSHRNGSTDTQGIGVGRSDITGAPYVKVGTTTVQSSVTFTAAAEWLFVCVSVGGDTGLEVSFLVVGVDSTGAIVGDDSEHLSADGDDGDVRSAWTFSEAIEIGRMYDGSSQDANAASVGYAAIYSRAFSIDEMRRLLGRTIGSHWPQHADLIAQWPMEEGSGTVIRDTETTYPLTLSGTGGAWASDPPHRLTYRKVLGVTSTAGQRLEPRATRTTISGVSMLVLDTDEWLTAWLTEISYAIRDRSAYLWLGWEGLHEDEYVMALAGTVAAISPLVGRGYEITISDLKRQAKRGVLRLGSTTSLGSLTNSDTTITPKLAAGFAGQTYAEDLGGSEPTGYVQIDDEIASYTAVTVDSQVVTEFTTVTRGALGTTAAAHADGASLEEVYVDRNAHPIDMALRLLVSGLGNNRNRSGFDALARYGPTGRRDVTEGRGAGISLSDIDLESWLRVKRRRYGYQYEGSLVVTREVDDLKEFVERELLRPLGAFLYVSTAGKLACGTWHGDAADASTPALERGDLTRPLPGVDLTRILNSMVTRYDLAPETGAYAEILAIEDADSGALHGRSESLVVDSPWIRSNDFGGATFRPVRKIIETGKDVLFGRFNGPIHAVETPASLSQFGLDIGDLVTLQHPHLPDFDAGARGLLGKAFQVIGRGLDLRRGRMLLTLIEAITTTITLTEDEDVAGFVETFTGTDLGASFSTGALDFTPKAVLVAAATSTLWSFGVGVSTSTTNGEGQVCAEFNGTAVTENTNTVLRFAGSSPNWTISAMSSAGVTLTRSGTATASTMYIVVVLG